MATGFESSDGKRIVEDVARRLDHLVRHSEQTPGVSTISEPAWINPGGPRSILWQMLGLNRAEGALLDVAIAVRLNPSLEARIAGLQNWPQCPLPTEALVRAAYHLSSQAIWRPTSPLARWQLLTRVMDPNSATPGYIADPAIADWMLGKVVLSDGLVGICRLPRNSGPTPRWDLGHHVAALKSVLDKTECPLRVQIVGRKGTGRADYARELVRALGRDTVEIDGDLFSPDRLGDQFTRAMRFAVLTGRVPVWRSLPPVWPGHLPTPDLQLVTLEGSEDRPRDHAASLDLRMPELGASQRHDLWRAMTGAALPLSLARADLAELRQTAPLADSPGAVDALVRDRALSDLSHIGRIVVTGADWDDLVVPLHIRESLEDYAEEARQFAHLASDPVFRRVFARDGAPTALFSGPPGVGKTMAAECISGVLGIPLLVIDVSRTVSKYIGETAKNLSRIFEAAGRHGCILFFDEADAFFGKRTDVKDSNDRHANADTGHLLQLVENYEGMVVLGTNKRGHLDEAFLRRIRHVIEFPKPTRVERQRLWHNLSRHLFAVTELEDAADALDVMAERIEMSPAQIKSAVLTAHYTTRRLKCPLDQGVLAAAAYRELRKEGRSLPRDLMQIIEPRAEVSHVA